MVCESLPAPLGSGNIEIARLNPTQTTLYTLLFLFSYYFYYLECPFPPVCLASSYDCPQDQNKIMYLKES